MSTSKTPEMVKEHALRACQLGNIVQAIDEEGIRARRGSGPVGPPVTYDETNRFELELELGVIVGV